MNKSRVISPGRYEFAIKLKKTLDEVHRIAKYVNELKKAKYFEKKSAFPSSNNLNHFLKDEGDIVKFGS